jgi:uracil-DNA glycosylase family 4
MTTGRRLVMDGSDPRRRESAFRRIFEELRKCKNRKTCPNLTVRCFYFEPNPDTSAEWMANDRFQEGIEARTVFVGESPGGSAKKVVPIDDPSTKRCWHESRPSNRRLHNVLRKHGFQNCYLTNTVKCGVRESGQNRHTQTEIENCVSFIIREIELIRPVVVVGMGENASYTLRKYVFPGLREPPIPFQITHYSMRGDPEKEWGKQFSVLKRLLKRFN